MEHLEAEKQFFHSLAPVVISFVLRRNREMSVVESKGVGDYSTQTDIDVENLIVTELTKHFPDDQVLAEEGYSDTAIPDGRIWLIDPICGTNNLGKGINTFCTNIALVDGGKVIAACVIDHSQGEFFWSVGNGQVYVNDKPPVLPSEKLGQKIDVDFGAVRKVNKDLQQKHLRCVLKLIQDTPYDIVSFNTSLGFVYTAIGKTDGFINLLNHPWDIAAASFLIQQVGGVITGIDGSEWNVNTIGAIAGRTPEIHDNLLKIFLNS